MKTMILKLAAVSAVVCCQMPQPAVAEVDEATAGFRPWSGYWFPSRQGAMAQYLGSYDQLTGSSARNWYLKQHPTGAEVPEWYGHCHAHSAASIMEREPTTGRTLVGTETGVRVAVDVATSKALLTTSHTQDVTNAWGDRFGDGNGTEDQNDLAPDTLWRLLKLHIDRKGVPLVIDIDAGPEVWNFPVYAYRIEYQQVADDGTQTATLVLLMADSTVQPGFVGTKVRKQTYQFQFQMRGGSVVVGSARWTGRSVEDHPDFAWYPIMQKSENPEVLYSTVQEITGGTARNSDSTDTQEPSSDEPEPQDEQPVTVDDQPESEPSRPATPERQSPLATAPVAEPTPSVSPVLVSPMEAMSLLASETSAFGLDVSVDRFDGGHYQAGETLRVNGVSEQAGFLVLLQVDPAHEVRLLYPRNGENNWVATGSIETLVQEKFAAGNVPGVHRIKALVTQRPLLLTGLTMEESDRRQPFRFHTTQRSQIASVLSNYQQQSPIDMKKLGTPSPQKLIGDFSQDSVAYYVLPAGHGRAASVATQPQSGTKASRRFGKTPTWIVGD